MSSHTQDPLLSLLEEDDWLDTYDPYSASAGLSGGHRTNCARECKVVKKSTKGGKKKTSPKRKGKGKKSPKGGKKSPKVKIEPGTKKPRCKNGYNRSKKSGMCIKKKSKK